MLKKDPLKRKERVYGKGWRSDRVNVRFMSKELTTIVATGTGSWQIENMKSKRATILPGTQTRMAHALHKCLIGHKLLSSKYSTRIMDKDKG